MSEQPSDSFLRLIMGRSTARLHALVFRSMSNAAISIFARRRLENLAEVYEKLSGAVAYNNTDSGTYNNMLPLDGASLDVIREIQEPTSDEFDRRPVTFTLTYTDKVGRVSTVSRNNLWDFFKAINKDCGRASCNKDCGSKDCIDNCGLPRGALDFAYSASPGDSVSYTLAGGQNYTIKIE